MRRNYLAWLLVLAVAIAGSLTYSQVTQAANHTFCAGPWVWETLDKDGNAFPHWKAPGAPIGLLDLRTLTQQGTAGGTPPTLGGMFVYTADPGLSAAYVCLSADDDGSTALRSLEKSALLTKLGLGSVTIKGANLQDILFEMFTEQGDPTGKDQWRPLSPRSDGTIELRIGSLIKSEVFDPSAHVKVLANLQHDYTSIVARYGSVVASQWLGHQYIDLGPAIAALITSDPPSVPATVHTESFDTANSDTLGPDQTWTELAGDTDIVSNEAQSQDSGANLSRADADLSSDDHYAEFDYVGGTPQAGNGLFPGTIVRKDSTATQTYYHGRLRDDPDSGQDEIEVYEVYKVITGSFTLLDELVISNISIPTTDSPRTEADGSTIQALNGVNIASATDGAITANLRAGMRLHDGGTNERIDIDNWEAGDLGVVDNGPRRVILFSETWIDAALIAVQKGMAMPSETRR